MAKNTQNIRQFGLNKGADGVIWLVQGVTPPQNAVGALVPPDFKCQFMWKRCPHELVLCETEATGQHPLATGENFWLDNRPETISSVYKMMQAYNPVPGQGTIPAASLDMPSLCCSNLMPVVVYAYNIESVQNVFNLLEVLGPEPHRPVVMLGPAVGVKQPPPGFVGRDIHDIYDPKADYKAMVMAQILRKMRDEYQ